MTQIQSNLISELTAFEMELVNGARQHDGQPVPSACDVANNMQIAGAAGVAVGGVIALGGLATGPGAVAGGAIGGATALAGSATMALGWLIGNHNGC